MLARRLRRLPERREAGGARVFLAASFRSRVLGLALLRDLPPDCVLRLPRCSSIHTFGMRFALDVTFLDREGRVLRLERGVGEGQVLRCDGAVEVLERRSGALRSSHEAGQPEAEGFEREVLGHVQLE
jgi:uncharacterized membrane protein (UPF0127 family)